MNNQIDLRGWFAGQALSNSTICSGTAPNRDLIEMFGPHRTKITSAEIAAAQAYRFADMMMEYQNEH